MTQRILFGLALSGAAMGSTAISLSHAEASASFTSQARFTGVGVSGEVFSQALFYKANGQVKAGNLGLNIEGFVESDFADEELIPDGVPDVRKLRNSGALQEAYVDYTYDSFFMRAGRQPVRWSQSWTLPSLDVFTGRRWNRMFLDPVPEQLSHPDGILLTYGSEHLEAEVFQVIQTPEFQFPKPFPNLDRELKSQTGVRVRSRLQGLDLQVMGHFTNDDPLVGASISYAFDCCVIKSEAGQSSVKRGFVIAGLDVFQTVFSGDFNFGPQFTWFQDPILTQLEVETIFYTPIRYSRGNYSFEIQYYTNLTTEDQFSSAQFSREFGEFWKSNFRLTAFVQDYQGPELNPLAPNLFSIYEELTGGPLYGMRLELTSSF